MHSRIPPSTGTLIYEPLEPRGAMLLALGASFTPFPSPMVLDRRGSRGYPK